MVARLIMLIGLFLLTSNLFAKDPNFYIYLCFGQSNMEGAATIESQDKINLDGRFLNMQAIDCSNRGRTKNKWYRAIPPLCQCWSGLTPADYFGRTMVAHLPDSIKIGIINVAIGGCDIRLFDKDIYQDYTATYNESWFLDKIKAYDGHPYQHLIDLAKLAQQDGIIKGILLHQGETNTGNQQWPSYVKKIYNDMLTDLSLKAESVPLLAGQLVHADQNGVCSSMNPIIDKLPQTIPTAYVISSSGCTAKSDNVHFNTEGMRELGKRYGETMLSVMGVDVTSVENSVKLPQDYFLAQNFPNPFNPKTSIRFTLPQSTHVTLQVLDVTGRIVSTLVDEEKNSGEHSVVFDASHLANGIYFYQIQTSAGFVASKKMILVK